MLLELLHSAGVAFSVPFSRLEKCFFYKISIIWISVARWITALDPTKDFNALETFRKSSHLVFAFCIPFWHSLVDRNELGSLLPFHCSEAYFAVPDVSSLRQGSDPSRCWVSALGIHKVNLLLIPSKIYIGLSTYLYEWNTSLLLKAFNENVNVKAFI